MIPEPEAPRCCTCGKPLARIPSALAWRAAAAGGFQCAECFYPGVTQGPRRRDVVSSERARWWTDLLEGGGDTGR